MKIIEDKRKVIQNFLENSSEGKNFRSIILEENFMFSDKSRRHLNYNHINLKSLKSIELLTSLYSDFILILHESLSTAAEIGMFSTSEAINKKLLVISPDSFTVDEEFFSGFMRLAYQNPYFKTHNIKLLKYTPGVYRFWINNEISKLHTFFVDNTIGHTLSKELKTYLSSLSSIEINFGKKTGLHTRPKNYYRLTNSKKLEVIMDSNNLFGYLISLFNITKFRDEFISRINVQDIKRDSQANRRKKLFKVKTELVLQYFKKAIYYTIKTELPNMEKDFGDVDTLDNFIDFQTENSVASFTECVSYFLYILYALSYIDIKDNDTRFSISVNFKAIFDEYFPLIVKVNDSNKVWR